MAKQFRRKRVSTAYQNRIAGHEQGYSDYELGCILWIAHKPLPLDASRATQQGYVKAAKDMDLVLVADMRRQYRLGRWTPLPKYRHLVAGIRVCVFDPPDRARYPLKRGQGSRLAAHMRGRGR